jgi:UDP-N-acetylmuramoyl-L-alanyl-D-glutamate--2,6-diaminopimelate ligase
MNSPEDFLNCGADKVFGYTTKFPISNFQFPINNKCQNSKLKIINAKNIKLGIDGSGFEIDRHKFKLNLPGLFNMENALAATCVGISEGIELGVIKKALEKITKVSGRMDEVKNKLGLKIIIDYAVTPDSLEKLGALISQQKTPKQSLIWVFGSCGERDRGKRPLMGEIVAKYADYAIVTNEDPYGEDPQIIIDAVFAGVLKKKKLEENKNCWKILDRREAIGAALKIAKAGDIILVTGKGAEETMAVGKKRISWNDKKVILEEIEKNNCHSERSGAESKNLR